MTSAMITFYYCYPTCAMASHLALEESGLPYQPVLANIYDEGERARYLEINPKGTVPAITVEGELVTENVAILTYVGRLAPASGLLPEDPWEAARCLSFLAWCSSSVHVAFRQSFRPERFTPDAAAHQSLRDVGRAAYWKALQAMDARVADQPYMMGDRFTVADCYPLVFYNWGLIADYPVTELPHLRAFKDRMIARPAVRRVLDREGCPLLPG